MTVRPADLGFVSISGGAGLGIRIGQFLTRLVSFRWKQLWDALVNYEHVFIMISDDTLIEAEPGGARVRPLSEYDGSNLVIFSMPGLTDAQRGDLAGIAQHLEKTPYSFLDYLAIALNRLHLPSKRLRKYVKSTNHMICSQMGDFVYASYGIHLFTDDRDPGDVIPLELYEQVKELGWDRALTQV